MLVRTLFSLLGPLLTAVPSVEEPREFAPERAKKVVLIAGPITGHPKNTHEYERSVSLLKHLLDTTPEISAAGSGCLCAYFPGREPDHARSTTDVCDGLWHHVGLVYEPDRIRLFVDGRQVADSPGRPVGKPTVPAGLAIGKLVEGEMGCDGVIDEVRIRRGAHALSSVPSAATPRDGQTLGLWTFDGED